MVTDPFTVNMLSNGYKPSPDVTFLTFALKRVLTQIKEFEHKTDKCRSIARFLLLKHESASQIRSLEVERCSQKNRQFCCII